MNVARQEKWANVIRECQEDWMLTGFRDQAEALEHFTSILDQAYAAYSRRFSTAVSLLNDATLFDECDRNRHKVTAFVQAVPKVSVPEMLVMVWRVLEGDRIEQVAMNYKFGDSFSLRIALRNQEANLSEDIYESQDIKDAALLRNFGISKVSGKPLFGGFYAQRRG